MKILLRITVSFHDKNSKEYTFLKKTEERSTTKNLITWRDEAQNLARIIYAFEFATLQTDPTIESAEVLNMAGEYLL